MILHINTLSFLQFITCLSCFTVVFLFFAYGKNKLQRLWAVFNLTVALWALFYALAASALSPQKSYLLWQMMMVPTVFIGITFHHFICVFTNKESKYLVLFTYLYCFLFILINFLNGGQNIFSGTIYLFNESYHLNLKPLEFSIAFLLWYLLVARAHVILYNYLSHPQCPQKQEAKYLFVICLIGFTGGCSTLTPMYGWHKFYPLTVALTTFYSFAASYAIFRRQLLAINIALAKGLVYSILASSITLLYISLIFATDNLLSAHVSYNSQIPRLIVIFFIALLCIPLKNYIQQSVDKIFLRGTPAELANENHLLRQHTADSEKMRTIATLASGVAHEIRNPLTALKTFVEYFPKKKNDPAFIEKFEKVAGSEICRIENILNELLAFAKPSPLTLIDTDIKKTLEHALDLTSNQLKKNNVEVKTEIADDLPQIKTDTNKILQVLINLIINAADAMPNGGTLTIVARRPEGTTKQSIFSISISDTGCGIEPKDIAKIFEPFFSTKEKGTGLGLAIVKGIVEDHGGEITVKSIKGQGTTFTITLPVGKGART